MTKPQDGIEDPKQVTRVVARSTDQVTITWDGNSPTMQICQRQVSSDEEGNTEQASRFECRSVTYPDGPTMYADWAAVDESPAGTTEQQAENTNRRLLRIGKFKFRDLRKRENQGRPPFDTISQGQGQGRGRRNQ